MVPPARDENTAHGEGQSPPEPCRPADTPARWAHSACASETPGVGWENSMFVKILRKMLVFHLDGMHPTENTAPPGDEGTGPTPPTSSQPVDPSRRPQAAHVLCSRITDRSLHSRKSVRPRRALTLADSVPPPPPQQPALTSLSPHCLLLASPRWTPRLLLSSTAKGESAVFQHATLTGITQGQSPK